MVQLNLLPDVKKDYLKAERMKRNIISLSVLASIVAGGLVLLLALYVHGAQRIARSQLQNDIDQSSQQLQSMPDLSKILTVQGALKTLPTLHDQEYANSNAFEYLKVLVPSGVSLSKFSITHIDKSLNIAGKSTDYKTLNVFADTLKNAQLSYGPEKGRTVVRPFENVTILSADTSSNVQEPGIEFTLQMQFNPVIFATTTQKPKMQVPPTTTGQGFVSEDALFSSTPSNAQTEGAGQ